MGSRRARAMTPLRIWRSSERLDLPEIIFDAIDLIDSGGRIFKVSCLTNEA
jgi:hypothetical protein